MNVFDQALAGHLDILDDADLMASNDYYPAGLGWGFPNPFKAIAKGVKAVTNKVKTTAKKAVSVVKKVAPVVVGVASKIAIDAAKGYVNGGISGAISGGTSAVKNQINFLKTNLTRDIRPLIQPTSTINKALTTAQSNLAKVATNPIIKNTINRQVAIGRPVKQIATDLKKSNTITAATALTTAQVITPVIEQQLVKKGMSSEGAKAVAREAAPAVAIEAAEKATGQKSGFNPVFLAPLALLAL